MHVKSRSLLMQKVPADSLHHPPPNLQSGSHLTVNDLHRMFLEKPRSIGQQQHQMRVCFPRSSGKCSLESSGRLVQTRITSYLNATTSSVCKTAEFEIFRIYTCSRKPSAQILDPFLDLRFSILGGLSSNSNLQALSRTSRHLFV